MLSLAIPGILYRYKKDQTTRDTTTIRRMAMSPFLIWYLLNFISTGYLSAVLWIRIRNNPNFLAGSESEPEKKVRIRIRTWNRIQTLL
jgi:hypothetical protein